MNDIRDGGPAFPFGQTDSMSGHLVNGWGSQGMTLRDYFAAKAMQAILSGPDWQLLEMKYIATQGDGDVYGVIAHVSYKMADAMIKEREK